MSYKNVLAGLGVALAVAAIASGGCGRSGDIVGDAGLGGNTGTGGGAGGAGGDITNFEPCAEVTESASVVPVNMYIMVDKSGSMDDMNKWTDAVASFTAFFQDPNAAALNVALRFWPDGACTAPAPPNANDPVACAAAAPACATPAVALGPLSDPTHQQALVNAFAMTMPAGGTPMSAALEGGIQWGQATLMTNPGERAVVVLLTDGDPNGCDEDPAAIAAIAAAGFANDGIFTYAVGLSGSNEATMNQIAMAGGSTAGVFIGSGNAQQDLLDAMLVIAGDVVQCTFGVPAPADANDVLDPKLVRVEYTDGASGTTGILPHVADEAACGMQGGWYYDDNANPTTITLCSSTCNDVQADVSAALEVALGCECNVDEDCPGDNICVDHHCQEPCVDDSECPAEEICLNGRCVPEPGDPCQTDAECPTGLLCVGGQCSYSGVYVGPYEAVQGGAFSCASSSVGSRIPRHWWLGRWWLVGLVGLAALALRRLRAR
jgi:hypothetical protein